MKEFRKTENGFFVCEECNQTFQLMHNFSRHVNLKHHQKNYFDKWLKEETDGYCIFCNKDTSFVKLSYGYKKYCSYNCECKIRNNSIIKTYKLKGKEIKEKVKQTCLKKYGVENPSQLNEIKIQKENTCLRNYGTKAGFCQLEKVKKIWLEKYGVENPAQNISIINKGFKTRMQLDNYKDTDLTYQGSYELDFLNKFSDKFIIENSPSIKYVVNRKNKVYHADFYIPSLNLIVEIKSSYTLTLDENIIEKKKATIANGFKYIMIIDKDYNDFKILSSS